MNVSKDFIRFDIRIQCLVTALIFSLDSPMALAQGAANPARQKPLTYCTAGNPTSFYPGITNNGFSTDAQLPIYNRLVEHEPHGTRLLPSLAERWEIAKDGLTYMLFLRQGVEWHSNKLFKPTRNFNADDVIFTLERQWKESHPFFKVTSDKHIGFKSIGMDRLLKGIDRVDEHTVRITLHNPDASFMANLATWWAAVQSKEYADKMLAAGTPSAIDTDPIGTGPFFLDKYERNASIRYKRFNEYFRDPAKVDQLVFVISPNRSAGWERLRKGECDVLASADPRDRDDIRANPDVKIEEPVELTVGYLAFNTQKKPFDDVRVRKAVAMAINKQSIIDGIFFESGVAAQGPLPPGQWGYRADLNKDVFDPVAAKNLLAAAGFPDGFKSDLWYMPMERAYMLEPKRVAELVRSDLQKIGVMVELKSAERDEYMRRLGSGDHQIAMLGWYGDNGDPDNFLGSLFGCPSGKPIASNIAHFCYPPMENLLQQAKTTSDINLRSNLYSRAQTIFKEQTPWLAISHSVGFKAMRKTVQGFLANAMGEVDFSRLSTE